MPCYDLDGAKAYLAPDQAGDAFALTLGLGNTWDEVEAWLAQAALERGLRVDAAHPGQPEGALERRYLLLPAPE